MALVVPVETGTYPLPTVDARLRGQDGCVQVRLRGNDEYSKFPRVGTAYRRTDFGVGSRRVMTDCSRSM